MDLPSIPAAQFARLYTALRKNLVGNTLNTISKFLDKLLPHGSLPFPVDEALLEKLSTPIGTSAPIWDELRICFHQAPVNFGGAAVCQWLNNIGATMGLVYGRQCERIWWCGNCGVPRMTSIQQTQDVILLNRSHYARVSQKGFTTTEWAFVNALVEVVQMPHAGGLTDMGSVKSYLTFLSQPHRRFTISLSFINNRRGQLSVTVTDRAGQVSANIIDLMEPSTENGLFLLSILAFLMFGRPEDIGLDPAFEINQTNGQVVAIECENRRFEVVRRIHTQQSLVGRGTQVWVVAHKGIEYIMKDSWVREDRIYNEVAHLNRMKDDKELVDRIPTLICGGDVVINGITDSTRQYRCARCLHRIHRRLVMSPVGEPLTSIKSKKEFIRVMISIIETHRHLYHHHRILHCDLSINNILLNRKDNESEAIGLLIDYDYSIEVDPESNDQGLQHIAPSANPQGEIRMGTPPFMSVEALLGFTPTFFHKPQHDLESILYIILFICTVIRGPGLRVCESDIPPPMRSWFSQTHPREIGYLKLAHLECYGIAIFPNFKPYWHDFVPFVKDLIVACFPIRVRSPSELQYEQALQILNKAYDTVKEPSDPTGQIPQAPDLASQVIEARRMDLKQPSSGPLHRVSKRGKKKT